VQGTVWYWYSRNVVTGRDAVRGPADGSHGELLGELPSRDRGRQSRRLRGRKYCFGICNLKFGFCNATCWASVGRKVFLVSKVSILSFMVILLIVNVVYGILLCKFVICYFTQLVTCSGRGLIMGPSRKAGVC